MKTIFGLASAVGKSGVAVIRVSGTEALQIAKNFGADDLKPRVASLAKLQRNEEVLDKAVVIYFAAPASFTGEDVVEFHVHGSRAVISKILNLLTKEDARMAEPGEFSKRAFENGKMDLTAAEGLADLIDAETDAQHKQAMRQMQGELGKLYDSWRDDVIALLANVEAYIDFPDEDLPQELVDRINGQIEDLKKQIAGHLDDNHRGEKIREGLYIAILGAPNVGKSSLLNFLAKRDAAIVSDIAGTTRDVIEVSMEISGMAVTFADTAGIRQASDEIESEGVKRALERAKDADLKIVMFEAGKEDAESEKLIDKSSLVVVNKTDENKDHRQDAIAISLKEKANLDQLLGELEKKISDNYAKSEAPVITRARHRNLLEKALKALQEFSLDKPIELSGEDLRIVATNIGQITGKIDVEEILDEIFSGFCIGK